MGKFVNFHLIKKFYICQNLDTFYVSTFLNWGKWKISFHCTICKNLACFFCVSSSWGYILLHSVAIGLSLIVSATIIRDREDELMEVGLSLCITKIGQRIILWYRLFFTSDQKIYNSFLEIFEIKINIFIVWIRTNQ